MGFVMDEFITHTAKYPEFIKCPISGYYQFNQVGKYPMVSRILNGITDSPRPKLNCNLNISSFKVCDEQRREIVIDVEENICVDYLGRPLDIYSKEIHSPRSLIFYPFFFPKSFKLMQRQ